METTKDVREIADKCIPRIRWRVEVEAVSSGLQETGYAHKVVSSDGRSITVAHHTHRNYDHIHTTDIGGGYVRQTGIGRRPPDLTPHPEAVVVATALNDHADALLRARSKE